ncbi:hypothetical protein ACFL6T_03225 [Candidatus Zixiibacteriota bacterium]
MAENDDRPVMDNPSGQRLGSRRIVRLWAPLAATWLMMSFEGPFLAAVIARMPDPKFNLAAYGVAFAFAIIVEAPVIMLMSASTALVDCAHNYRKLRNFTFFLNVAVTVAMLVLLIGPVFNFIVRDLMNVPDEVADLIHGALILMIPWPAAIGFRRFYQGLLIRDNLTRRVAWGTVIRLSSVVLSAIVLFVATDLPGSHIGAAALSIAVTIESIASRFMVRGTVNRLLKNDETGECEWVLSYGGIANFYYPLALTSVISLAVHPVVTFFMGHARYPVESLAVLPVLNALTFIFRSVGLSFQEVVIALVGRGREHLAELARFAFWLAVIASGVFTLIALTPLSRVWYETISGLSPELARFALTPTRILMLLPALSVLLSFQRGFLVHARATGSISWATVVEMGGIVGVLLVTIHWFGAVGATAAAIAFMVGRLGGNLFLIPPCLKVQRNDAIRNGLNEPQNEI